MKYRGRMSFASYSAVKFFRGIIIAKFYSAGRNIASESALPIILMKKIERKTFKLLTDFLPRDEK